MNPLLLSSLISAALAFGVAWKWHDYRMDAYQLGVANEKLAVEQSSRQHLAEASAKVAAAQDAAKANADRVRRDAAGAAGAATGMRDTLASAVRAAHTDLQACTRQVDALGVVFQQSVDAYRELAQEADSWAIERVMLQEAWPK